MSRSKIEIKNNQDTVHTQLAGMQTKEHEKIVSRITGRTHEIQLGPVGDGKVPRNPFASLAQAGYMHTHPEVLGKAGLKEWDNATRGKHLPKKVKK